MERLKIRALGIAMILLMASRTYAVDCSLAPKKLSGFEFLGHTLLIKDSKLDEALLKSYESFDYLGCIKNYSNSGINYGALNLGAIYTKQELDENKAFTLYNERLGKYIKDTSFELYIFMQFALSYGKGLVAEYDFQSKKDGQLCLVETGWGSVYFGCNDVYRVSNSAMTSVSQLNETSLTKALLSLAYIENSYSSNKSCYKKSPPFESLYAIYPMMIVENQLMKISSSAPMMSKKLLEKALKLEIGFNDLVSTCNGIGNQRR